MGFAIDTIAPECVLKIRYDGEPKEISGQDGKFVFIEQPDAELVVIDGEGKEWNVIENATASPVPTNGDSTEEPMRDSEDTGDEKTQDAPVTHECEANAQALINISRKRLCMQAAPETRRAWTEVKNEIAKDDPVLASVMVAECIYRGFCPEMKSCGYCNTPEYREELTRYRKEFINE